MGRVGDRIAADIDAGLKVAVDLGADVINMSFGTPASAVLRTPAALKGDSLCVALWVHAGRRGGQ
jgi:subtilisin family serine protease